MKLVKVSNDVVALPPDRLVADFAAVELEGCVQSTVLAQVIFDHHLVFLVQVKYQLVPCPEKLRLWAFLAFQGAAILKEAKATLY